jgi:hypothetical protein
LGYKPVYSQDAGLLDIVMLPPQEMKNPGKIYVKDSLILQNDQGLGIHVYDKTDPSHLVNKGFIRIKGNLEISLRNQHIYANSFTDLVIIDISNWSSVKEIKRIPDAFYAGSHQSVAQTYIPVPESGVYYECPQWNEGIHVGWEKDSVYQFCFNY